MNVIDLLSSDNYCIFNKQVAKKLSTNAAIIIGLLCSKYNSYKKYNQLTIIENDEYFYCTREDIFEDTGLKEDTQRSAMKLLKDTKILTIKRFGVPSKNYYHINQGMLEMLINEPTSSTRKTGGLHLGKIQSNNK